MTGAKLLLLVFIIFILYKTFLSLSRRRIHLLEFLLWVAFWTVIAIFIAVPSLTQQLADLFGIVRGVDLMIYISTIVAYFLHYYSMLNHRDTEKKLTELSRIIALQNAEDNTDQSA